MISERWEVNEMSPAFVQAYYRERSSRTPSQVRQTTQTPRDSDLRRLSWKCWKTKHAAKACRMDGTVGKSCTETQRQRLAEDAPQAFRWLPITVYYKAWPALSFSSCHHSVWIMTTDNSLCFTIFPLDFKEIK